MRGYLECANIYKGNSSKNKTDLIEMILYGCITDKLHKNGIEYISTKEANQILSKHKIKAKLLPRYGNAELKKKKSNHMLKKNHLLRCD